MAVIFRPQFPIALVAIPLGSHTIVRSFYPQQNATHLAMNGNPLHVFASITMARQLALLVRCTVILREKSCNQLTATLVFHF